MARIRCIKPETPSDRQLAQVSRDARLTFIYLWTQADDDGLLRAEPRQLLGALFPHDDDVDGPTLTRWLSELLSGGFIQYRSTLDGMRVIQIANFGKHQTIKNRSKPFLLNLLAPENGETTEGERRRGVEPTSNSTAEPRVLSPESRVRSLESGDRRTDDRRFLELMNKFPLTGGSRIAVTEFLDHLPGTESVDLWVNRLLGYLQGLDMPPGVLPSPESIVTACRDWNPRSGYSALGFRAFVLKALEETSRGGSVKSSPLSDFQAPTMRVKT